MTQRKDEDFAISIENISKNFLIREDTSLKSRIVSLLKKNKINVRIFKALSDVSTQIKTGETVGLLGHNGSGKSTLLKMIGGIIEPSNGIIVRRGRVAALLELGAGFHPDLTGRENVYLNASLLGMSKDETDSAFEQIVNFSGISQFIDTQVKFYSSGMYVRLAFAVAVHSNPDILLVDEVLAVGDEPFQRKCLEKIRSLQKEGKTIVLVSHSSDQVRDVCQRAIVLNHGTIVHDGNVVDGIRALHYGYEQEFLNEATKRSDKYGSELPASIESILIYQNNELVAPGISINSGSNLEVRLTISLRENFEWITGFTLHSNLGHVVYRLNTEGAGIILPLEPGRYQVNFNLPNVNFGSDFLTISAGITSTTGRVIDETDGAFPLQIQRDEQGAGFMQFKAVATVKNVSKENQSNKSAR